MDPWLGAGQLLSTLDNTTRYKKLDAEPNKQLAIAKLFEEIKNLQLELAHKTLSLEELIARP